MAFTCLEELIANVDGRGIFSRETPQTSAAIGVALLLADGGEHALNAEEHQGIGAHIGRKSFGIHVRGDQLFIAVHVDAIVARMHDGGGADA